jgi:hypothetical protein
VRECAPRWFGVSLVEGRGLVGGSPSLCTSSITRRLSPHSSSVGRRLARASARLGIACAVALSVAALPAPRALATPPPSSPQDDAAVLARLGDRARLAGRFTEAAASYRASLALVPDEATALSLALALAAQGKAREAAPLLARLVAAPVSGSLPAEDRERAARALADARRDLATVTIQVGSAGAIVEVDGAPVGLSPLPEPLFLAAGHHTVRAARDGYRSSEATFEADADRAYTIQLGLLREAKSGDTGDGGRSLSHDDSVAASPFAPGLGSYLAGPGGAIRAAGITLSAAGLIAGVSALVAAEVSNESVAFHAARVGSRPDSACACPCEEIERDCARIDAGKAARGAATIAAGVLLGGSGVAAAATLLSIFLLPPSRPAAATVGGSKLILSPHAGPWGGGVSLEASW